MGRDAHFHSLARKADMQYDKFMATKQAIYLLQFMNEKVNVFNSIAASIIYPVPVA